MEKNIVNLVRQTLKDAHQTLEDTMKDVTSEVAHWKPQGKALPISAAYAHVVASEDVLLSWIDKNIKPLVEQGWDKKLGLNIPHPPMDMDWEKNYTKWTKDVKVDLPKFREYAKAVYEKTDTFLEKLTDKDILEEKVDLSAWGLGKWSIARFIMRFLTGHADNLTGEISAAKGLQNRKGYPF